MATIKDIAERAGVSIGTVDRIIHERGRYSTDTAARVREIMEELDYSPNMMARNLSKSISCRIGVFLPWPEQDSEYWRLTLEGVKRAGQELGPFGLSLEIRHFDRYDSGRSLETGLRLAGEDFDGILLAPLREEESRSLLERLGGDTPVVFFDTDLPGAARMSYIGQDSYVSGRLAGRLMNLLVGADGAGALVLTPDADNEHLEQRVAGFRDVFAGPVRSIRITIESDHDRAALHRILDAEIAGRTGGSAGPLGIFVADASAHYAAEYLAAGNAVSLGEDDSPRCALLGYDLVPENRRWLEKGVIDFLLTQRPDEQGYEGVNRLFRKIVLGEDPPEHIYTPIDIMTRENVAYHGFTADKEHRQ